MNLKLKQKLVRYGRSLIQFFLPQYCEICGKEDSSSEITSLCKDCLKDNLEKYPNDDPEYCKICVHFFRVKKSANTVNLEMFFLMVPIFCLDEKR